MSKPNFFNKNHAEWFFFISVLALSVGLSGCANIQRNSDKCFMDQQQIASLIDMKSIIDASARELCTRDAEIGGQASSLPRAELVVVTDFVNIHNYVSSPFGVSLGNQLRTSLNYACNLQVRQVDLLKDFKLGATGFTALTKDSAQTRNTEFGVSNAIIGTYDWQPNKLFLTLKKINIASTAVSTSVQKEVSWSCGSTHSRAPQNFAWNVR